MADNIILKKHTYEKGKYLIVCGAGKFEESKLVLDLPQAMLLYVDLHKYIMKNIESQENEINTINTTTEG